MRKLLAAAMVIGVVGCSGEGDIDRTQVNKVHKSMFQGTWYLGLTATACGLSGAPAISPPVSAFTVFASTARAALL